MGHYMDIKFTAKLNDLGIQLISDLYETKSWLEVCKRNADLHPSILVGVDDNLNVIPFSGPSKRDEKSSEFDPEAGIWKVGVMFKWKGSVDEVIANILQYIIAEPTTISSYHELWEKWHTIDIGVAKELME